MAAAEEELERRRADGSLEAERRAWQAEQAAAAERGDGGKTPAEAPPAAEERLTRAQKTARARRQQVCSNVTARPGVGAPFQEAYLHCGGIVVSESTVWLGCMSTCVPDSGCWTGQPMPVLMVAAQNEVVTANELSDE